MFRRRVIRQLGGTLLVQVFALLLASAASAQTAPAPNELTENDVVRAALSRAPLRDLLSGRVALEQGRARVQSAYANPEVSYSREQTFGSAGTAEDYLVLSQSIDLGNRRGLRSDAARFRVQAAQREGQAAQSALAAEARRRFYDLLYRQQRVQTLAQWSKQVDTALDAVSKREAKGDVATYDRRRLAREHAAVDARLATERAELASAAARVRALLPPGHAPQASGSLLPEADPAALDHLEQRSKGRADLASLDLQAQASAVEAKASRRWWAPDLKLEAGWKGVREPGGGRVNGYVAGASLALPVWDRSAGGRQAAEAEQRALRGQRALLMSEIHGELLAARTQAVELRQAAIELDRTVHDTSRDVIRMASLGYEGGELGVLEVLDAYRSSVEDELTALDLAHDARLARIELDRLSNAPLPAVSAKTTSP